MALIGMPEAARRAKMSSESIQRALRNAGVPLVQINERSLAVEEKDLQEFIKSREGYSGRGRPKGTVQTKSTAKKK